MFSCSMHRIVSGIDMVTKNCLYFWYNGKTAFEHIFLFTVKMDAYPHSLKHVYMHFIGGFQTRWYCKIFQMQWYLFGQKKCIRTILNSWTKSLLTFVTISVPLTIQCIEHENISFCSKKCLIWEFVAEKSILSSFQISQSWYSTQTTFSSHFGLFKKISF